MKSPDKNIVVLRSDDENPREEINPFVGTFTINKSDIERELKKGLTREQIDIHAKVSAALIRQFNIDNAELARKKAAKKPQM